MEKLLVMNIAAQLTQAATAGVGGNLPVSPDLSDNAVRAKNLHVWETFRVFYHALNKAFPDNQNWPVPTIEPGQLVPSLVQSLAPILGPQFQDILSRLIGAIQTPSTPTGPVPDPGT